VAKGTADIASGINTVAKQMRVFPGLALICGGYIIIIIIYITK
jgi:hypothetical protein